MLVNKHIGIRIGYLTKKSIFTKPLYENSIFDCLFFLKYLIRSNKLNDRVCYDHRYNKFILELIPSLRKYVLYAFFSLKTMF